MSAPRPPLKLRNAATKLRNGAVRALLSACFTLLVLPIAYQISCACPSPKARDQEPEVAANLATLAGGANGAFLAKDKGHLLGEDRGHLCSDQWSTVASGAASGSVTATI